MDSEFPSEGRLAGIDYGHVRIGVALTDRPRKIASPYETYARRDAFQDARYFRTLVAEERVVAFVVGLPVHTDGNESQKSQEARRFGEWLAEETGKPVRFYDERYSTAQAEELLQAAELTSKERKRRRDMLAAQIMLTAFLDSDQKSEHHGAIDD